MSIDWEYPERGTGLSRIADELIGPGATRAEIILVFVIAILGGIALLAYQYFAALGWTLIQIVIGAIIAFDIAGGVVASSTSTAKRWYHRKEQGSKQHLGFIAFHFIHPLLITVFFLAMDWSYFAIVYGYLVIASVIVIVAPLYLKRPVSVTVFSIAVLLSLYVVTPVPGFEWFIPMFFLKLVIGHLVREEPYQPTE
ncbi:MAG: hypothetical protein ACFE7R_08580 [Candidatus Hodarchaeota archaeon]